MLLVLFSVVCFRFGKSRTNILICIRIERQRLAHTLVWNHGSHHCLNLMLCINFNSLTTRTSTLSVRQNVRSQTTVQQPKVQCMTILLVATTAKIIPTSFIASLSTEAATLKMYWPRRQFVFENTNHVWTFNCWPWPNEQHKNNTATSFSSGKQQAQHSWQLTALSHRCCFYSRTQLHGFI